MIYKNLVRTINNIVGSDYVGESFKTTDLCKGLPNSSSSILLPMSTNKFFYRLNS